MEHSKLPWKQIGTQDLGSVTKDIAITTTNCYVVADIKNINGTDIANAAFIVKACNYHQDLMDACRNLLTDEADKDSVWRLLDEIQRSVL